ncbi:putative ADP-ribosylation factor GTPase-activating protein AGD14 isoform X5 [Primulina tabacum]|uniref:putative ADP-ribosylation factor GTPase-activating protein AGD14 isoform X5 n=1 Tax=Primulina tabacum TaxID=48773 RepID=UPI003F5A473F
MKFSRESTWFEFFVLSCGLEVLKMSTKREEEKNEKIIRGLMKLPPNRRCINCNSLGPQYVCTNFWTFVCTTCSGIHREFTHRVKSVSMAKFTSQEVEALQNGGNQRARELFLKAWDPQRQRLPDNSNVDKVREFIKNVYVQKKYTLEKPSDKPPKDPQSLRNHEDDTRRASSYHSYSQSPPYDFQYEERRYGKHAPALTRKPGSDRGLYEGKLSGFLSPSRFSDHTSDDRFANEGSNPRASDYSISSGGDPFKSDALLPRSQREIESPSGEISREIPKHHAAIPNSDASNRNAGGISLHPQRTVSLGSIGSYDINSMSFKSGNSTGSLEVAFESEKVEIFHDNTSISPHPLQSSVSGNFNNVDLFGAPFAPQIVASPAPTVSNSQKQESTSAKFTDFFQRFPASVPIADEPKPSQVLQPSAGNLFAVPPEQKSAPSFNSTTSDVVMPNNEGWATFDRPQNILPMSTGNSTAAALPPSDGTLRERLNPFSLVQNSSVQEFVNHEPSVVGPTFWSEGAEGNPNITHIWNAFEDPARLLPLHSMAKSGEHAVGHHALDIDKPLGFGVYEVALNNNGGNVRTSNGSELPSSSLSLHFNNMALHDSCMAPAVAGVHPLATDTKPTNPFDLPYDSEIESGSTFWGMGCLQAALPNDPMPTSYVGGVSPSWLPQNSGSLGFMAGQTPSTQIPTVPAQGPVASIGSNPFA